MLTEEECIDANFKEISKPPKFDFDEVMRRMELKRVETQVFIDSH